MSSTTRLIRCLALVLAVALIATACGSGTGIDGETSTGDSAGPTDSPTDPGDNAGESPVATWCSAYEDILAFEGDIDGEEQSEAAILMSRFDSEAPPEISDIASRLAEAFDREPVGGAAQVAFARDLAVVSAFAERECGTDAPFCSIWPLAKFYVASLALGRDGTGDATTIVAGYNDLIVEHLPADLADDTETLRGMFSRVVEGQEEREAEAAVNRADDWVDANCTAI